MLEYVLRTYKDNDTYTDMPVVYKDADEVKAAFKTLDHEQSLIPKNYLEDDYWKMRYEHAFARPGHLFCPICVRFDYVGEEVSGY